MCCVFESINLFFNLYLYSFCMPVDFLLIKSVLVLELLKVKNNSQSHLKVDIFYFLTIFQRNNAISPPGGQGNEGRSD